MVNGLFLTPISGRIHFMRLPVAIFIIPGSGTVRQWRNYSDGAIYLYYYHQ